MEIYTQCKIDSSGNLLCDTGRSIQCSVTDDLEGWDGMGEVGGRFKGEGTHVSLWLIHDDVWQKPVQYCNAIIFQ